MVVDPDPSPPSPPFTPLPIRQNQGTSPVPSRGESMARFTVTSKGGTDDDKPAGLPHRRRALSQRPGPNGSRVLKKRPSIPRLGDLSSVKIRIWGSDATTAGSSSSPPGRTSDETSVRQSLGVKHNDLIQSTTPPMSLRSRLQIKLDSTDEDSSLASSLTSQRSRYLNGLSTPDSSPPTPTPAKLAPAINRTVLDIKQQSLGAQPEDFPCNEQVEDSHSLSRSVAKVVDAISGSVDGQVKVIEASHGVPTKLPSYCAHSSIVNDVNLDAQPAAHLPSVFPAAQEFLDSVDQALKQSSGTLSPLPDHHSIHPPEPKMFEQPLPWSTIYPGAQSKKQHLSRQIELPLLQKVFESVGVASSEITPVPTTVSSTSTLSNNRSGDLEGAAQHYGRTYGQANLDPEVTIRLTTGSKHQVLRQKLLLRGMLGPCGASGDKDVHVFIDMSNIFIGFQDLAKIKQGKKKSDRVKHSPFAFDQLALILERERRVAKRKLAGSVRYAEQKSNPPVHFEKARVYGYKPDIFVQVPKCDTPRRAHTAKFHMLNGSIPAQNPYWTSTSGDEDLSEGFDSLPRMQPRERLGEQGVDEHLHHEMSLSVYRDAEKPGIMVLATGDAQPAEYSDGFAQYAIQALEKGWYVEIVSWKHCLSSEWKRSPFRDTYAHRFRIIELDDFYDDLLEDWA